MRPGLPGVGVTRLILPDRTPRGGEGVRSRCQSPGRVTRGACLLLSLLLLRATLRVRGGGEVSHLSSLEGQAPRAGLGDSVRHLPGGLQAWPSGWVGSERSGFQF